MEKELLISFPKTTNAEGNQLADELRMYLIDNSDQDSEIVKEREDTMDFGATLAIILGTSSVVALSRGIANWIMKQQDRKVKISIGEATLEGSNLSTEDIKLFIEKITNK